MSPPGTFHDQPVRRRVSDRTRCQPAEFCELCNEPNPIEPDAFPPSGLWICVECVENTLQGAVAQ